MRPVICAPLGITTLPSSWTGVARLAANVSPTLFLSVASVWPTVALISVPFGTVTIAAGCGALVAAAGFAGSAFLAVLAGSLVAVFEQPARVKTAAAAKASQRFRCTWEWNISNLQRGTFGVNGVRWLVGPIPRLQIELETAGTLLSLNPTESGRWSPRPFRTRVSYPAPAYRPVRRSVHSLYGALPYLTRFGCRAPIDLTNRQKINGLLRQTR